MKIPKISTSVAMALSALALFVSLWLVWYNNFYYVLKWMENYTFYSSSSDMIFLGAVMPGDVLKVVGAWLMQFYYYPVVGATVQALLPVMVFLAAAIVVVRLFKESRKLLWIAMIPVVYVVGNQFWDNELDKTLTAVLVSWGVTLRGVILTLKKGRRFQGKEFISNGYVAVVATLMLLGTSLIHI